jgi:hypothetical protein
VKFPLVSKRSNAILLVDQADPTPRFLVAAYDQKQLKVLLKGQVVRDEEVSLAQQLRHRLNEESINCSQAVVLLGRPAVEFFSGSMPPAEPHEMPDLVANFVAQESDDVDDRVIDYVITGGDHQTTTDVLAMTCERKLIETAQRQFREAGFKLSAVTYNGFGAVQLIHQVAHQKLPITIAITSSDSSTEIAVLQQRQPVLFRTIQRGVQPGEVYSSALAAELQRTLAYIGAGDHDSALIYLIGHKEELAEVAEVLSETVSSSVTITGVLDQVDVSAVTPFDDAPSYAQLIGVASAVHQNRLPANFLSPRKAVARQQPWQRLAPLAAVAAAGLVVVAHLSWSARAADLDLIAKRQATIATLAKQSNQAAELQDIVDTVSQWQQNDITWLDELKDLSDRFPERNQSLVRKMTLSAADNGAGVVDLSVQVKSPQTITELETAIRDERHSVSSKRVTEINDSEELTWSFDTRIVFRPLPRPAKPLPEPVEEVTVDGVVLEEPAAAAEESSDSDAVPGEQNPAGEPQRPSPELDQDQDIDQNQDVETSSGQESRL